MYASVSDCHLGDEKLAQPNFTAFIFILLVTRPSANYPAPHREGKKKTRRGVDCNRSYRPSLTPNPHPLFSTARGRDNTSRPWCCCQPLNLFASLRFALCDERRETDQRENMATERLVSTAKAKAGAQNHCPSAFTCSTHTHTCTTVTQT